MAAVPLFKKQTAERKKVKLMLALTGTAGAGKTYSALQIASGLVGGAWEKITLADTENGSALYYAGDKTGPWEHVPFDADMPNGYAPENWIKLIEYAEGDPKTEVLILDSISHEWEGKNGVLELVDLQGKNKFSDGWKAMTPRHRAFIDKMRSSRLHIIATMRSAAEYVVEQNDRGKSTPRKVGTKSKQREGTDYEFGVILDVDLDTHLARSAKDRTGLFAKRDPFLITKATGVELLNWANEGKADLYTGDLDQKKIFAATCKEVGIEDKTVMAELSAAYVGKAMDQLPQALLEWLTVEEAKRRVAAKEEANA